jgi:hypothetical protein
MGQFKPMVKMMTTEPSVELKLKKGGKVAKKADGGMMGAPMGASDGLPPAMPARGGMMGAAAPMKPSLAMRRRAMKGLPAGAGPAGPVGGAAQMQPPMGAPSGMPAMKKGGKAEGGKMDMAQDKAMIKKAFKQHDMQEHKGGKGTSLKLKKGGKMMKFATGGAIPSETTSGSPATTIMHQAKPDNAPAKTGGVKNGNGGGFKTGGKIKKMATGGVVKGQAGYATGGAIPSETTSGSYATTEMHSAKPDNSPAKTGGVKDGNGGGYKRGGSASKKAYAAGGTVDSGRPVAMPQGRKPIPKPVEINELAGTYKKGGMVAPGNRKLQAISDKENAPAMRAAKAMSNEKYGPASTMKLKRGGMAC